MTLSENRCPPRIKCGAGIFRIMRAIPAGILQCFGGGRKRLRADIRRTATWRSVTGNKKAPVDAGAFDQLKASDR
jgi:hypothetical protein